MAVIATYSVAIALDVIQISVPGLSLAVNMFSLLILLKESDPRLSPVCVLGIW